MAQSPISTSARDLLGPLDGLAEGFERCERSSAAFERLKSALIEQYPNQWVAFHDGEFVGHGADPNGILESLSARGIARADVQLRFVSPKRHIQLL